MKTASTPNAEASMLFTDNRALHKHTRAVSLQAVADHLMQNAMFRYYLTQGEDVKVWAWRILTYYPMDTRATVPPALTSPVYDALAKRLMGAA